MTAFRFDWDDREVRALLARALEKGTRLRPLMLEIGYGMVRSTLDRIEREVDPDGNPWVELKPETLARKRTDKMLQERGYLRGGIAVTEAGNTFVELAADREYAAIQQHGGTPDMAPGPAAIPAREYMGFSKEDSAMIEASVIDFLSSI